MIAEWFVLSNNQAVGPYTPAALLGLMRQGSVLPTSQVRRLDEPWTTAAEAYARLAPTLDPEHPAIARPTQDTADSSPASSLTTASATHRRRPSAAGHPLVMLVGIVLGGVAAVFTYSKIGHLFRPRVPAEPNVANVALPPPQQPLADPAFRPVPQSVGEVGRTVSPAPAAALFNPLEVQYAPRAPAPPPPNPRQEAEAWKVRIQDIFQRRMAASARLTALQERLQPLVHEQTEAESRFRTLFRDTAPLAKSYAELKQKLETLRQLQILARSKSVDKRIADAEKQLAPLEAQKKQIDREAVASRTRLDALTTELATARNEEPKLLAEVDRLTAELVRQLAPCSQITSEGAAAAEAFAEQVVLSAPPAGRGWSDFVIACLHARRGANEAAEAAFGRAIAALPREAVCLAVRGVCRACAGKAEEGLADVAAALKAEPQNWTVHYLFALVQCGRGAPAEAESHLQECLKLQGDNTRAHALLALLKSAVVDDAFRNGSTAQRWAQTALELKESSGARFALAAAAAENGNFDDALRHAEQALTAAEPQQRPHFEQGVRILQTKKPLRMPWVTLDFWSNI